MKRFLIILVLIIFPLCVFAENEYETQEMLNSLQDNEIVLEESHDLTDNVQDELSVFDYMGKNEEENKDSEITPIQKVLKSEITRTDIPSYLFKEYLTFNYEKGIISQTQYYGVYRGGINNIFSSGNHTAKYNNNATEFGMLAKFRDNDYGFKIMFRPIPVDHASYLDNFFGDIYLESSKIKNHKIVTGFQRVQKGMEGGTGQYTLPFYNRSQIARSFGNTRSLAAKIVGDYKYADYSVSFGSSSPYLVRGFTGGEFTSWLNLKPFGSSDGKLGKLTLGGGFSAGHNNINYTNGSVYLGYKHKKLWTNFEAAIADGYSGSQGISPNRAKGLAYTLGWKFTPHVQLIGRIDQFDPDRHKSHDLKREYTAGINWFIKGQALRFIFNYVYCQNQNTKNSHRLILGTQVMI